MSTLWSDGSYSTWYHVENRITASTVVLSTIQRVKVSLDFLLFACRSPKVVSAHRTRLECLVNHLLDFLYSDEHREEAWNLIAEGTLLLLSTLERLRASERSKGTAQKSWADLEDVLFVIERTTSLEVLGWSFSPLNHSLGKLTSKDSCRYTIRTKLHHYWAGRGSLLGCISCNIFTKLKSPACDFTRSLPREKRTSCVYADR